MKFGTMLKDILESFSKKPATQMYPEEKIAPPARYRGELFFDGLERVSLLLDHGSGGALEEALVGELLDLRGPAGFELR